MTAARQRRKRGATATREPKSGDATSLDGYLGSDPTRPTVAVELVILTIRDADLKVLLVDRAEPALKGAWALPGGLVRIGPTPKSQGESLDDAAQRQLAEKTHLPNGSCYLEQLYTFGAPGRDPRTRVISVAYFALLRAELMPLVTVGVDTERIAWFSIESELPCLALDHGEILQTAIERIQGKIDFSPIAFSLVPETFTATELREVHEAIKGRRYDAPNFRRRFRRMLEDGILEQAPGYRVSGQRGGRPAQVYRFRRG